MLPRLSYTSPKVSFSSFCFHVVALLVCNFIMASSATTGNETDRLALLEFRAKINGDPLGVFNSWNDTLQFCEWRGVTCGRRHQRVTKLDLQALRLSGSISPHVGNLSFLRELYLQNNSFSQSIPPQIGRLRRLQELFLNTNSLRGEIPPNISGCSNLVRIQVQVNQLEGSIPMEIGFLSKVQNISFGNNHLTGSIPPSLGNLSSLKALYASDNNFSGSLPPTLGQLENLMLLQLSNNEFSGIIPASIFNLSSILAFDIRSNRFTGYLPSELGNNFPNIKFFSISLNQFSGSIPNSISNFSNILKIQLGGNKLSGKVPSLETLRKLEGFDVTGNHLGIGEDGDLNFLSSLTNVTTLQYLGIANNSFGGKFPEKICNLSRNLRGLFFDYNQIYGNIPNGIDNLVNLEIFQVTNNKLSGNIPSSIGKLRNLRVLYLFTNYFSGEIPSSLGNLTNLILFSLMENNLHGIIPSSIGQCQSLLAMELSYNNLSGTIPSEIMSLSSLSRMLDLSNNYHLNDIATDIAYAIEYLHLQCERPIIHCDLKPSNILLDDDMTGRVSDFGLAKFFFEETFHSSANESSSVGLRGTIGYAPPEYAAGSEVSTYGDIYSYGILLLEMFTGKRPTDNIFIEGLNLHNYVKMALPEQVGNLVDPILLEGRSIDRTMQNNIILECLISIFEIGISCSAEQPHQRMNISDAASRLRSVKNKLLKSRVH
ncbi:serine-threonine protein kinase, plant-type, putative [Ricinus communis]|uniref:non-specific serine/threonine protein kinase n=1 Tax=Ricinus communis TaxID=3988 RepID=B9SIS0_RICCO|nr:serine-threonine protein kinase, plant-type, putative [Ricinus communis]